MIATFYFLFTKEPYYKEFNYNIFKDHYFVSGCKIVERFSYFLIFLNKLKRFFYSENVYTFVFMENITAEIKKNRGRQPVPVSEKKMPITIWVKNKHLAKAKRECSKLQLKYQNLTK